MSVFKEFLESFRGGVSMNDSTSGGQALLSTPNTSPTVSKGESGMEQMEDLITVINKLQDVFNTLEVNAREVIQLPQIVVVGSQSSGKSSVLESLVGRSFLPRGTGLVTRCPLVLQMIYAPMGGREEHRSAEEGTLHLEEWCKFLHNPDEVYTDFGQVLREIENQTDRLAGSNKGIVPETINLKVYSARLMNLTVVDLPGIVKVPVGDQPLDIEDQVKGLIMHYIGNPNSIILAVCEAPHDLATCENIKLAKEVDPDGKRTLAVLTKLDLMDAGTDAREVLLGNVIKVELGIIGVINRSQSDIHQNKSISEAIREEKKFLQRKYPELASQMGTPYLAKKLNRLLMCHIYDCLPALKVRIREKVHEFVERRTAYGDVVKDIPATLATFIKDFETCFEADLDGTLDTKPGQICGGGKISSIFHEKFRDELLAIRPLTGLTDDDIHVGMRNAAGLVLPIIPEAAFRMLVKKQIRKLEEPSIHCVDMVYDELREMLLSCAEKTLGRVPRCRFSKLKTKMIDVAFRLLEERSDEVYAKMQEMVATELVYVNAQHPDFKAKSLLFPPQGAGQPAQFSFGGIDAEDKETRDCRVIKILIESYFGIVKTKIQDSVPKILMLSLVEHVREKLGSALVKELMATPLEEMHNLLIEDESTAQQRQATIKMLEALRNAGRIITECEINRFHLQ